MNGKNKDTEFDLDALEEDVSRIAPLVRRGFASVEPSPRVVALIHAEAFRQAARKHGFWHRVRILSLAASLFVLAAGGVCQLYLSGKAGSASPCVQAQPQTIDEAAELLLSMQGLDADSFFNSEEAESAWL